MINSLLIAAIMLPEFTRNAEFGVFPKGKEQVMIIEQADKVIISSSAQCLNSNNIRSNLIPQIQTFYGKDVQVIVPGMLSRLCED